MDLTVLAPHACSAPVRGGSGRHPGGSGLPVASGTPDGPYAHRHGAFPPPDRAGRVHGRVRAVRGALRVLGRCHRGAGPVAERPATGPERGLPGLRDLQHGGAPGPVPPRHGHRSRRGPGRRAPGRVHAGRPGYVRHGRRGLPAGGHGKPEREHGGRVHFTRIVVCPAGACRASCSSR